MTKIKVIKECIATDFERKINLAFNEGYVLYGEPSFVTGENHNHYFVCMILHEETK